MPVCDRGLRGPTVSRVGSGGVPHLVHSVGSEGYKQPEPAHPLGTVCRGAPFEQRLEGRPDGPGVFDFETVDVIDNDHQLVVVTPERVAEKSGEVFLELDGRRVGTVVTFGRFSFGGPRAVSQVAQELAPE